MGCRRQRNRKLPAILHSLQPLLQRRQACANPAISTTRKYPPAPPLPKSNSHKPPTIPLASPPPAPAPVHLRGRSALIDKTLRTPKMQRPVRQRIASHGEIRSSRRPALALMPPLALGWPHQQTEAVGQ